MKYKVEIIKIILIILMFLFVIGVISFIKKPDIADISTEHIPKYQRETQMSNIRMGYIKLFVKYLDKEMYSKAYDMLTANSKRDIFKNDLNRFEKFVTSKLTNKNKPNKKALYEEVQDKTEGIDYKIGFVIENPEDYLKQSEDISDSEYYNINIINVNLEENKIYDYKLEITI